jgi:hypothetical protein
MIEINLTAPELMLAAQAGVMRQVENLKKNQAQNTLGYDEKNPWQIHIEGACGEMVIAKMLNQYWKGKGKWGDSDVGEDDVRTSPKHYYRLRLHHKDSSDRIFWHVTGMNGIYQVHGWIHAIDGKKEKYWSDIAKKNRPAFFVPIEDLHKPEEHPLWPKNNSQTLKNF